MVLKALFVLIMPAAVFFIGGYSMMHFTGREQFQSSTSEPAPLHFRIGGYDTAAVDAYWKWLGPDGRLAERRFLKVDLAFPLLYGGALIASLLLAWGALGRPFSLVWLVAPIAITVLADWVENIVQWRQLDRYLQSEPLQSAWIQVASVATSIKAVCFGIAAVLLLALAVRLLFEAKVGRPLRRE